MRKCGNCVDGHYVYGDKGERIVCRIDPVLEEETKPSFVCGAHRYMEGLEEEHNFVLYDESYLGKGFFIVNCSATKIKKFLKIYLRDDDSLPDIGIRAVSFLPQEDLTIEFDFRDLEDSELDLFRYMYMLAYKLSSPLYSSSKRHGSNCLLNGGPNMPVVRYFAIRDPKLPKENPNTVDIHVSKYANIELYDAVLDLYNKLAPLDVSKLTSKEANNIVAGRIIEKISF